MGSAATSVTIEEESQTIWQRYKKALPMSLRILWSAAPLLLLLSVAVMFPYKEVTSGILYAYLSAWFTIACGKWLTGKSSGILNIFRDLSVVRLLRFFAVLFRLVLGFLPALALFALSGWLQKNPSFAGSSVSTGTMAAGSIAFILGVIYMCRRSYAIHYVLLEGTHVGEAIAQSSAIMRREPWYQASGPFIRTAGTWVSLTLLSLLLKWLGGISFLLLLSSRKEALLAVLSDQSSGYFLSLGGVVLESLIMAFSAAVITLLFYEMQGKYEKFGSQR